MKVWVTLDRTNGQSTVKGPIEHDELDLFGLLMYLNTSGVCGVTFTRHSPLRDLIKSLEADNGKV